MGEAGSVRQVRTSRRLARHTARGKTDNLALTDKLSSKENRSTVLPHSSTMCENSWILLGPTAALHYYGRGSDISFPPDRIAAAHSLDKTPFRFLQASFSLSHHPLSCNPSPVGTQLENNALLPTVQCGWVRQKPIRPKTAWELAPHGTKGACM
ncbi:unnamed protein product [Leuciscus chuanchicus]